jgi:hypothetical protein
MAGLDASTAGGAATPRIAEWRMMHLAAPLTHLAAVACTVDADSTDSVLSHCAAATLMHAMHDTDVRHAVSAALNAHAAEPAAVRTAAQEILHTLSGARMHASHACMRSFTHY